jgi:hypothetical protein
MDLEIRGTRRGRAQLLGRDLTADDAMMYRRHNRAKDISCRYSGSSAVPLAVVITLENMAEQSKQGRRYLARVPFLAAAAFLVACPPAARPRPLAPKPELANISLFVPLKAEIADSGTCRADRAELLATKIASMAAVDLGRAGFVIIRDSAAAHDVVTVIRVALRSCPDDILFEGSGRIGLQTVVDPGGRSAPMADFSGARSVDEFGDQMTTAVRHLQRFSDLVTPATKDSADRGSTPSGPESSAETRSPSADGAVAHRTSTEAPLPVPIANAPAAPSDSASPQPTTCFPACRTGFLCSKGQCISRCNPVCAVTERCTAQGECVSLCNPPCAAKQRCTAEAECVNTTAPTRGPMQAK